MAEFRVVEGDEVPSLALPGVKVIFGQEFRKKSKLASKSKQARQAFHPDRTGFMTRMPSMHDLEGTTREVIYGADIHRVASYLQERAEQHEQGSPP